MIQSIYNKVSIIVIVSFVLFIVVLNYKLSNLKHVELNKQAVEDMVRKYKTRIEVEKSKVKIIYKDKIIEKYLPHEGKIIYEESKEGIERLEITTSGYSGRLGTQFSFYPLGVGFTFKVLYFKRAGVGLGLATFPQGGYDSGWESALYGLAPTVWFSYKMDSLPSISVGYRSGQIGNQGVYGGIQWDF